MLFMPHKLRIGLSAAFFHPDPQRALFKGKTLLYLEEQLTHWVLSEGVYAYLIPSVSERTQLTLTDIVADLDGIILQGGADVAPESYGETALRPEWRGDAVRDLYEMALVKECLRQRKPILGVCRGAQLLNVALGGSLYQDISTQVHGAFEHRNWQIYDRNFHTVRFEKGSRLEKLYGGAREAKVNSIHHQAVKVLGKDLNVEARSAGDGVIEAIRYKGESFAYGLQWHPEFHDPHDSSVLDGKPVLREFLSAAQSRHQ